jgi:hypothetical protein
LLVFIICDKQPHQLPTVLTKEEVRSIIAQMSGVGSNAILWGETKKLGLVFTNSHAPSPAKTIPYKAWSSTTEHIEHLSEFYENQLCPKVHG